MAALAVYGALFGLLDVSMNACAARLKLGYGPPITTSLHAGYSIAGLACAGTGGISAWLGACPLPTFAATAAALIALSLLLGPRGRLPRLRPLRRTTVKRRAPPCARSPP